MMLPEEQSTPTIPTELWSLAEHVCAGTMTAEQYERLNDLLRTGGEAARFYAMYLRMHGLLMWHWRDAVCVVPNAAEPSLPEAVPGPLGVVGDAWHQTTGFFSQLVPFSYLVATVFMAVGMCLGLLYRLPNAPRLQEILVGPIGGNPDRSPPVVGHISATADCRWADPDAAALVHDDVPLDRTFVLAAGYLEITYDSGAKVILQGPCTYKVESATGGFLSIGKLTALVTKKALGSRVQGSRVGSAVELPNQPDASGSKGERTANRVGLAVELPNRRDALSQPEREPTTSLALRPLADERSFNREPSASAANLPALADGSRLNEAGPSPLFSVRTPTATVTDLGTEFGVEVTPSGATRSHVFQGRVELRPAEGRISGKAAVIELVANQVASVEVNADGTVKAVRHATGEPAQFVRTMPRLVSGGLRPNIRQSQLASANYSDRRSDWAGLGDSVAYACAIDAAGRVVPYSPTIAGTTHVFLYSNAEGVLDLGTLGPGNSSLTDIEMAERVAATQVSCGSTRIFLHIPGEGMKDIGTLGGPMSLATRINAARQVVGCSATANGAMHAFLCSGGKMQDLGTLGGNMSFANDIDAAGRVVGASRTASGAMRAFLYAPGAGMKDLGALGGPKADSWAFGIDDAGRISGCSAVEGGRLHAFRYSADEGMRDFGDIGDGNLVIRCVNGKMCVDRQRKEPPTIPDAKSVRPKPPDGSPRRAKEPVPPTPDIREERRALP